MLLIQMLSAHLEYWKPFAFLGWEKKQGFTRHLLQNYTVKHNLSHRMKAPHFIPVHPMAWLNYMLFGSQLITGKPMECLRAMVFYLIMKAHCGEKLLLQEK